MRLDLVVFDMIGTAVDDEGSVVAHAILDALADSAGRLRLEDVRQCTGLALPDTIDRLIRQHARRFPKPGEVALVRHRVVDRLVTHFLCDAEVSLVPGARDAIAELRARGIQVALTTGLGSRVAQAVLLRLGWSVPCDFDCLVTSDDVGRSRPGSNMVDECMRRLGIRRAEHVAKVGDTPFDVLEGVESKCGLVIGVRSSGFARALLSGRSEAYVLESVAMFVPFIDAMQQLEPTHDDLHGARACAGSIVSHDRHARPGLGSHHGTQ